MGHSSAVTSEIFAEVDRAKAKEIAAQFGKQDCVPFAKRVAIAGQAAPYSTGRGPLGHTHAKMGQLRKGRSKLSPLFLKITKKLFTPCYCHAYYSLVAFAGRGAGNCLPSTKDLLQVLACRKDVLREDLGEVAFFGGRITAWVNARSGS